ncbi:metal-dependent transcriptional regulator [[Clostridium] scindens]|uniref:metal-dependent transcriptional regulator n=1 Tax=Clostridium scindens (strain JCM 10418 / VPI 12708) TaxID=29347 RepID=UPI001D07D84E|nr:metal-dependent transcriptional regulator [[Clostridium] scindens]MCB7512432.1 metal-dependent transcriptional regulator [bacterium 210917-SL.2.15]MCB6284847.1 metal-dependent transcriptional regulator [[Clostridium] scindens]MCB6419515.1 metal-dependent transcriptional regulator [[Clostridium] scindens]MCB7191144.1 metal-dependent transcriptional regulator [[Clostridium] scindens]MCB7284104.1 metal-dependent transcriptional regulator [[Clostridium] scindens]
MKLYSSGENYLKAIYILHKERGMVRSVDVATYMGVSKPSVSHAVKTLQECGVIYVDDDHYLHLTEDGRDIAEKLYERYQYFAEHLAGAGVDATVAKEEACKMEHSVSHASFQLLKEQKQNTCPFADSCQLVTESKSSTKEDN